MGTTRTKALYKCHCLVEVSDHPKHEKGWNASVSHTIHLPFVPFAGLNIGIDIGDHSLWGVARVTWYPDEGDEYFEVEIKSLVHKSVKPRIFGRDGLPLYKSLGVDD